MTSSRSRSARRTSSASSSPQEISFRIQSRQADFVKGASCNVGEDNFAMSVGCGDVAKVETPSGNHFKKYRCGNPGSMGQVNFTVPTVPHVAGADEVAAMGI